MDNREFDNIFAKGLQETQSFDSAEAGWKKLSPRLHPPKKRKRFLLWPFFMVAALLLLGISTFWYYQQSTQLKQEVYALNELLEEQLANETKSNSSASIEDHDLDLSNTRIATENNLTKNPKAKNSNLQPIINTDSSPKNNHKNPRALTPVNSKTPNKNLLDAAKNSRVEFKAAQENQLPETVESTEPIATIALPADSDKAEQLDFIYAMLSPLDYERVLPELKFDLEEATAEEEEPPLKLSRWTIGVNANIVQSTIDFENENRLADQLGFPAANLDRAAGFNKYYQFGLHSNFALNNNWQLRGSIQFEKQRDFFEEVFIPTQFISYQFQTIAPVLNSQSLAGYESTETSNRSWLLDIGINRKIFSIKKIRTSLGVHGIVRSTTFGVKYYEVSAPRGNSIGVERRLPLSYAIAPSLTIAGPIARRFYWQVECKTPFNINSEIALPNFSLGLGFGYRF